MLVDNFTLCVSMNSKILKTQAEVLHVHLGVVDEIFQRVSTGVIIFELSVIGDYPSSWIIGAYHTTHIDRLDVGEVSKHPCAGRAGGLKATFIVKIKNTGKKEKKVWTILYSCTNQKVAATSVGHVKWEGESDDRWGYSFVQGSSALCRVEHVVEDEQRFIVASIDNRAGQDGQAN